MKRYPFLQEFTNRSKQVIAGGSQLLSKKPEMFAPDLYPSHYRRAKGCTIWDVNNVQYTDFSHMSVGCCLLGYADDFVNIAVCDAAENGSISSLSSALEVELAEEMIKIHRWADMARFAKTGGEAMAIAIRLARAASGRDKVLFCGYHGWQDWYASAGIDGISDRGVPRVLKGTSIPFKFNDVKGFLRLISKYNKQVGTIVIEPVRYEEPTANFVNTIQDVCKKLNIVFIVDEITSGFRFGYGGAHLRYNIQPDIAVFGKAMSNGYPMACVIGKKWVMREADNCFISSTYWTDAVGLAASIATLMKLKSNSVAQYIDMTGAVIKELWEDVSTETGVPIKIFGLNQLPYFEFENDESRKRKTLFTQLMLEHKILAYTHFYPSLAHKVQDMIKYSNAFKDTFKQIKAGAKLKGRVCEIPFKRYT